MVRFTAESAWVPHSICGVLALVACVPLLWPQLLDSNLQETIKPYAGPVILGAIIGSVILLAISCVRYLLRMQNLRALWQLIAWGIQWGLVVLIFIQMAIEADVASPRGEADAVVSATFCATSIRSTSNSFTSISGSSTSSVECCS